MVISVPDGYGVIAEIDDIRESSLALEARSRVNHEFGLDGVVAGCIVAARPKFGESKLQASDRFAAAESAAIKALRPPASSAI
jgi:hypothetical protein